MLKVDKACNDSNLTDPHTSTFNSPGIFSNWTQLLHWLDMTELTSLKRIFHRHSIILKNNSDDTLSYS